LLLLLISNMLFIKCWQFFKNRIWFFFLQFPVNTSRLILHRYCFSMRDGIGIHITRLYWETIFVKTDVRTTKKVNLYVCLSVCVNVLNFLVFVTRPSCVQRQLLPHIIIRLGNLVTYVSNHFLNWKPPLNYLNRRDG